jgi:glycerol kinase
LGAAYLAGLETGVYKDLETLKGLNTDKTIHTPQGNREDVLKYYDGWKKALKTKPC